MRARGRVARRNVAHHGDVQHRSPAGAVEHDEFVVDRRCRGGEVDGAHRLRFHRRETEQVGGDRSLGRHDHRGGSDCRAIDRDRGRRGRRHGGADVDRPGRQPVGELLRDGLHARCGHGRVAVGEHPEDHVEHAPAVAQVGIELDAADQRPEEPLDDRFGEPGIGERSAGRSRRRPGGGEPGARCAAGGATRRCGPCRAANRSGRSSSKALSSVGGTDRRPPSPCHCATRGRRDRRPGGRARPCRVGGASRDTQ